MNTFCDAFISYGRADSLGFGRKLYARLLEEEFNVWFDQNDIPLGVDFQNQIDDGIEKAHNFLFLIAPHSVNSPYCLKEIELAIKRNKRIIPLLHVEQISRETWQERFPHGTNEGWETYQAQGKHTSFKNIHPAIGKINWVYFREGIDDFEKSFSGLIELLKRQADYVEQHTQLLAKALEWERHQKRTSRLLIGDDKHQAQTWLKIRFKDEQPPCIPTDLHCEYITESIKNANNLMTQVFISYADADRATMEKIRRSLRRESITVWTNTTDIQTGEAFEEAIQRGIEQADNVVYLLSPDSVTSYFARKELDYALSLNKRIIPVLVRELSSELIPNALRDLQYIDLTDNVKEDDYLLDESQLLKILHEDAAYYNEHKVLLTKALKWKRQHENPSILLRGYNLRSAETWLKVAQKRTQHPPIPLQEEFIAESLRQPPAESLDVFVSYSRTDADFARKLNDSLQIQGKTTWFDQESIASGSDFQQEIYRGIKACDNFLFILSPRSVNSIYCADEVEYAAQLNKRFVTVLHREVNSADLHPELGKVQWIDFNHNERDFNANFNQLVRTLDTDREHVHNHTKWLQRAIEWDSKGKSTDLLLRGSEFAIAKNWLQESEQQKKQPAATLLHKEFIEASRKAIEDAEKREKRQIIILRSLLGLVSIGFLVSIGVGWIAIVQFQKARENQHQAEKREVAALIASSEARLALGQPFQSLLIGLRAGKKLKVVDWRANDTELQTELPKLLAVLQQSLYQVREFNSLEGHQDGVADVSFSADGKAIATTGNDETVKLWTRDGRPIFSRRFENSENLFGLHSIFSPDGQMITIPTKDKKVMLWRRDGTYSMLEDKQNLREDVVFSPGDVIFSPDSQTLATWSPVHQTMRIWRHDGTLLSKFNPEIYSPLSEGDFTFSPDGQIIATASVESKIFPNINLNVPVVQLWRRDGTLLATLIEGGNPEEISAARYSPNSQIVELLRQDGTLFSTLKQIKDVTFSPDGQTVAIATGDKTVRLWQRNGTSKDASTSGYAIVATLKHDKEVESVRFSPDGKVIATTTDGGMVKLWRWNGTAKNASASYYTIATFKAHQERVDVTFSPKGQTIATFSPTDRIIKVWGLDGTPIATLGGHNDEVTKVRFSPDGEMLASVSRDATVKLWNPNNNLLKTFPSDELTFFSDHDESKRDDRDQPWNQIFVTKAKNGRVKLWKADGTITPIAILIDKNEGNDVDVQLFNKGQTLLTTIKKEKEFYGPVQLWKADGTPIKTLIPKTLSQGSLDVSLSKDGQTLVTTINDEKSYGPVQLWKTDGTLIKTLIPKTPSQGSVSVDLSKDGQTFVTTVDEENSYGPVQLWKANGTPIATVIKKTPSQGSVSADLSKNGRTLATTINEEKSYGPVQLWKVNGTPIATLIKKGFVEEDPAEVSFSDDGQALVTKIEGENSEGPVQLWKADGTPPVTLIKKIPQKSDNVDDLQIDVNFSKDCQTLGTMIYAGDSRGPVQLWKADGTFITTLIEKSKQSLNWHFSDDRQTIVTVVNNGSIKLWKANGTPIATLTEKSQGYQIMGFSPDNQTVALTNQRTITLWNLDGSKIDIPTGHTSDIYSVIFSPNGRVIASASGDKTIKLWERNGTPIATFTDHSDSVTGLNFSADSKMLASSDEQNVTIIRSLDGMTNLDGLLARGCKWMTAYLRTNRNLEEGDKDLCDDITKK